MAHTKTFHLALILFFLTKISQIYCDINCSRQVSRRVSHAIRKLLKDKKDISKHLLPECAFNQEHHIFNYEEKINIVYPTGERQCGFCGEIFQDEKTYDQHMGKSHPSLQSGEFYCAEKLCTIFGECGEPARVQACSSAAQDESLLDFCRKTIKSCFSEDNKDSKLIGIELNQKLCNKERILEVNRCIEKKVQQSNANVIEFLFHHFSKALLIVIMLSTFFISYKINLHVNKIK
ncbi:hypothetical protein [Cryptosporidium parvum Iowa II]|uniref:C2H2-type domain-containing protein n=2 Tax=Cryptosporidium parvum TaxID=5807 RepID=Q5CRJ1_CRYPI|nr:hypothetical protein [Cryptosporidium parvum Iowa II]EAK87978.1 hypothetical protein with signal peptide, possible transmembrane domain near C-terminus and predicted SMART Znf_C2H2 domain [Cryptosporidium parvum Iowa II]QOY41691.1 Uncharacterized protein with C2H2-type Zinc finger [Cryptosporidium parvum]WKS77913.1 putative signal peptide-containing protein [Cryptosporidium sp. 43IA8]WRK32404.1 C2H2-type Zinc finger protein [Cryptosporidium parvum]|eukprot:QOY41691.1 hypothetical protein CPATCC_002274 [Cryptosporidium parvum]